MNTDELSGMLRSLPPAMHDPADRFEAVAQRARTRARTRNAAVAGAAAVAVVVVGATAVLVGASPTAELNHRTIATEPPSPTESIRRDESASLPGATTTIELSQPVAATATGTSTLDLGPRPRGATAATVSVACLTAGHITYPDGSSLECDGPASDEQIADPTRGNVALLDLDPDQTSLIFRAADDVGWKVVATYVRTETSDWGVNAKGETFGVPRDGKSPDLIAVHTTDGRQGYAYVEDLDGPVRSVPVYESDGETLIGEYMSG